MRASSLILGCLVLLLAAAPEGEVATPVDVHLLVRGPDARPLMRTEITIHRPDPNDRHAKAVPLSVVTDNQGVAKFQLPCGVQAFEVSVASVGYGQTGLMEYVPGQIAQPLLSPLAPYGSISGTVPPGAMTPGAKIMAGCPYSGQEEPLTAQADAKGNFKITGVHAGLWWVWAGMGRGERCADGGRTITVYPGQAVDSVDLKPVPAPTPAEKEQTAKGIHRAPLPGQDQEVVWVQGTVRDESAQPIANASVFALATYHGGLRMYQETAKASTDAQGHYEIRGPGGQSMFSATLVAFVPGKPPVWDWPNFSAPEEKWIAADSKPDAPPVPAPPTDDLVIPSHGGALNVTVLRDGHPAPGALVAAYLENANLKDEWAAGGGPEHDVIEDIAYPIAIADDRGVAHLENLLPGRYDLYVSAGDKRTVRQLREGLFRGDVPAPYAIGKGINVRFLQTTDFTAAIYPQPNTAFFRLLRPDGTPLGDGPGFSYGPVDSTEWNTGVRLDPEGLGQSSFQSPGLWRIEANYRILPVKTIPISPPFIACIADVAVSPLLDKGFMPSITARRIEPASVKIVVKDAAGKPLQVPVELDRPLGSAVVSGSTDENGQIVFAGLYGGYDYIARAFAPRLTPLALGDGDSPLPSRQQLGNRTEIVAESFLAVRNEQTNIVLSPQPVAYVMGKLQFPAGTDPKKRWPGACGDQSMPESGATGHVQPSSGQFVAGPFRPGPLHLHVGYRGEGEDGSYTTVTAELKPGEVKDLEVISLPPAKSRLGRPGNPLIGMGGASAPTLGAKLLDGRVFFSDTKTPALGAQVFYFESGQAGPTILAISDALGNLHARGLWRNMNAQPPGSQIGPAEPTLVALLPGQCGGVVLPLSREVKEPLRIVLPAPISISGQVKIGDAVPTGKNGAIRVLAAYQDAGALNSVLSVFTSADADGHFTLAGLTPGTYQIQATLDNIWLSASTTLRVSAENTKPAPLTLSIGVPGAPVLVHLRDAAGKPAIGKSITIDRPPGPLADTLWPKSWTSDGAGVVYIPTLETGPNVLHVPNSPHSVSVVVPALPTTRPAEIDVSVGQ